MRVCERFYPVLRGGGSFESGIFLFSSPPPLHVLNDQSLRNQWRIVGTALIIQWHILACILILTTSLDPPLLNQFIFLSLSPTLMAFKVLPLHSISRNPGVMWWW